MKSRLKAESGFTLIEVVVAIVIITALVATFALLIVASVERIQWAGRRTQELYAIRSAMEKEVAAGNAGETYSIAIEGQAFAGTAVGKLVRLEEEGIELVTFFIPLEF